VQLPFATGKSFTLYGLREKLRELFRQEVGAELRAGAALNNVESYRAHFFQLAGRPYRLRILNGVVSLLTTYVENKRWPHLRANRVARAEIFK